MRTTRCDSRLMPANVKMSTGALPHPSSLAAYASSALCITQTILPCAPAPFCWRSYLHGRCDTKMPEAGLFPAPLRTLKSPQRMFSEVLVGCLVPSML